MSFVELFYRSLITYSVLLLSTRLMGRKQIAQLTFFDYAVSITMGSIAASMATSSGFDIAHGIFCIVIWAALTILISEVNLRNINIRLLIDSEPLLIVDKGKVVYKNMKKARYNIGDLLMQLRDKDVFYITDVEAAILEPDGKLSVLRKAEKSAVTAEDMNVKKSKSTLMVDLILDGKVLQSHLKLIGRKEDWLKAELARMGFHNLNQIVYAGLQGDGQIYLVLK